MGDYPPQYYSPRARKYYRKRPSVAGGGGGAVGSWKELGRTTLGSNSNSINVSSLADKRYYMVLYDIRDTSGINPYLRLNSDSGSNYSFRYTGNGSADIATTNSSVGIPISASSKNQFCVGYYANYSSKEKLSIQQTTTEANSGAGTSPTRGENVGKHAQTSNPISSFNLYDPANAGFATGSEVVVLGYDPADTHTTIDNFWQELASVELSSAGDQISSGTISAKKYLWIQYWIKADTASDVTGLLRFNNDNSANYSSRYSLNGGADSARTNRTYIDSTSGNNNPVFVNAFIINNASNEKLVIGHGVWQQNSGSGTSPNKWEFNGKWCNTSNQITEIDVEQLDAGDLASGSILKVWGAD